MDYEELEEDYEEVMLNPETPIELAGNLLELRIKQTEVKMQEIMINGLERMIQILKKGE